MRDTSADPMLPLDIGPGERWVLDQVRTHGVTMFVAAMTAASVVASLVLVVATLFLIDGFSDPAFWGRALVLGVLAPIVIAPPLLVVSARLVARLDTASRLLQESAVSDPLTGVRNRRGFFAALGDAGALELEIGMVDVDDFKSINDRFGHATGDTALCMVAAWLEDLIGDDGTVGRLGGDEFAYVTRPGGPVPRPQRHAFRLGDATFTITIGRAVSTDGDTHEALLAADAELYRLKQTRPEPTGRKIRAEERDGET